MGYKTLDAAREIGNMPNGLAVMRVLQAHGINWFERREWVDGTMHMIECCDIDR